MATKKRVKTAQVDDKAFKALQRRVNKRVREARAYLAEDKHIVAVSVSLVVRHGGKLTPATFEGVTEQSHQKGPDGNCGCRLAVSELTSAHFLILMERARRGELTESALATLREIVTVGETFTEPQTRSVH